MYSKLVTGSLLAYWSVAGLAREQEDGVLSESITDDVECTAESGDQSDCSLNLLQRTAMQQTASVQAKAHAESEAADADRIEASREMYASYYASLEEEGQNLTSGGSCAEYGCVGYTASLACQCNSKCGKYNSCCPDYQAKCGGSQAPPPQSHPHSQSHRPSQHEGISVSAREGITPPSHAFQHNGMSWPAKEITGEPGKEMHFFAIGDWGGLDGAFTPPDDFPRMIVYPGGNEPGPHIFPRSRIACSHNALVDCYFNGKKYCNPSCGFDAPLDAQAQLIVAEQFKKRAALHDPQFILNVGDNFYWGGIAMKCGHPMSKIHPATVHQFTSIFENIYSGPGLDGKPWLSTLGNHDWGGRQFTAGWDQQIAYTWASDRWRMPAAYWHQRVNFPDYSVDVYMVDSNFNDAEAPYRDPEHNICGQAHNPAGSSCAAAGGPSSVAECQSFFHRLWEEEKKWLDEKLSASDADWQIAVTHFPCDSSPRFWRDMHYKHGLDLLVTGHRHDQELWKANQPGYNGMLGGLTCFVTGGGGGITSEESPLPGKPTHNWPNVNTQYGFFDMTISKEQIKIESIDHKGDVVDSTTVEPKAGR